MTGMLHVESFWPWWNLLHYNSRVKGRWIKASQLVGNASAIHISNTNPVKHFNSLLSHHKVSLLNVQKTSQQLIESRNKRLNLQDLNYKMLITSLSINSDTVGAQFPSQPVKTRTLEFCAGSPRETLRSVLYLWIHYATCRV